MSFAKTLSRDEMKNVKAGRIADGGRCLHCVTPNGTESWYHDDPADSTNPTCNDIYPAYDDVSGSYGPC